MGLTQICVEFDYISHGATHVISLIKSIKTPFGEFVAHIKRLCYLASVRFSLFFAFLIFLRQILKLLLLLQACHIFDGVISQQNAINILLQQIRTLTQN